MSRRENRDPLSINVAVRAERRRYRVELSDLSCRGCRIVAPLSPLTIGDRLSIRPDGMESLTGTVRWSSSEDAGFEFDYPLHPAVASHLCRQNPPRNSEKHLH